LIRCPECRLEDISHVHIPGQYDEMICSQCATRFKLDDRKNKIVKIVSDEEVDESSKIVSNQTEKAQKEFEERARKLREEVRK
jgi:hypothetical protein